MKRLQIKKKRQFYGNRTYVVRLPASPAPYRRAKPGHRQEERVIETLYVWVGVTDRQLALVRQTVAITE